MSDDCVWRECKDFDEGAWESDCGGVFELNHGRDMLTYCEACLEVEKPTADDEPEDLLAWFCPRCATLMTVREALTRHCCQSPRRDDCPLPAETPGQAP